MFRTLQTSGTNGRSLLTLPSPSPSSSFSFGETGAPLNFPSPSSNQRKECSSFTARLFFRTHFFPHAFRHNWHSTTSALSTIPPPLAITLPLVNWSFVRNSSHEDRFGSWETSVQFPWGPNRRFLTGYSRREFFVTRRYSRYQTTLISLSSRLQYRKLCRIFWDFYTPYVFIGLLLCLSICTDHFFVHLLYESFVDLFINVHLLFLVYLFHDSFVDLIATACVHFPTTFSRDMGCASSIHYFAII